MTEGQVYVYLRQHTLSPEELRESGYPIPDQYRGQARIYKNNYFAKRSSFSLPSSSCDSDSSSSSSSSELRVTAKEFLPSESHHRMCSRCYVTYSLYDYLYEPHRNPCRYHSEKLHGRYYACCGRTDSSDGCNIGTYHVWNGLNNSSVTTQNGYVTAPCPVGTHLATAFALDCEMCYTFNGLEPVKITVVSMDGRKVYESFIFPKGIVIDYNTRYSGITAQDIFYGPSKTLQQVQTDLMSFINASTILIGHALDNDLRVLKILHSKVVDTALEFPHYYGNPYRRSLKSITEGCLRKKIQTGEHDSYEDALACVELMLWKINQEGPTISSQHAWSRIYYVELIN